MKSISSLLSAVAVASFMWTTAVAHKPVPEGWSPPPGPSPEETRRTEEAADRLVDAILIAPDLTFKMPVLESVFLDNAFWESRVKVLIEREEWDVAKMHFIHFYWKRVTKKDPEFMERSLAWVEGEVRKDESLTSFEIVADMIEVRRKAAQPGATDNPGDAQ